MSEYPKTTEVTTIIQQEILPVAEESHTHDNKSVLDSTTASYTAEEQQKLAEITPNDYATKEALAAEALSIREAMIPLTRELHSHQNMATLDALTPELMTELGGLQQFEDRTLYEIQTLNEGLDNLSRRTHTHDNQAVLDETTASYTLEEQQKLASINPSEYATKADYPDAAAVNLMIQKITYPLSLKSHEHENKEILDALTEDEMALLGGLQQFEDSTIYEMQTFRESIEPVVSQAHWHHNLTLLNSITAAKIAKWDSFENFGTQINGLSTRITVYSDKVDSSVARIGTAELNIESLQKQIDALKSGRNYTTLFHYGKDAMSVYAPEIGIVLNGGYHLMNEFCELYPNFCSSANDHAISYSQEDFNWDAQLLTVCTKELSLTENSEIVFNYQSGATEDGSLYLVAKPQYSDVPVTIYVKDEIEAGRAVSLNFKWLQSDSFISTVTECGDISAGMYYLAWVGRSNNTHPLIRSVKVLEG